MYISDGCYLCKNTQYTKIIYIYQINLYIQLLPSINIGKLKFNCTHFLKNLKRKCKTMNHRVRKSLIVMIESFPVTAYIEIALLHFRFFMQFPFFCCLIRFKHCNHCLFFCLTMQFSLRNALLEGNLTQQGCFSLILILY